MRIIIIVTGRPVLLYHLEVRDAFTAINRLPSEHPRPSQWVVRKIKGFPQEMRLPACPTLSKTCWDHLGKESLPHRGI